MTCIVAYADKEKMVMAGDSAAMELDTHSRQKTARPKIFKKGEMLIGYTWSFRMGQLIEFADFPQCNDDPYRYMVTEFVPALRQLFADGGFLRNQEGVEGGGEFLVALRGQMFEVNSDFSVLQTRHPFAAVGSGLTQALPVMHYIHQQAGKLIAVDLTLAIETAAVFNFTVLPPVDVIEMLG